MALVPLSVRRSMVTSSAFSKNRLYAAVFRRDSRSARVVARIGSTIFTRNGSMMVCNYLSLEESLELGLFFVVQVEEFERHPFHLIFRCGSIRPHDFGVD